jgi:plastocyanin
MRRTILLTFIVVVLSLASACGGTAGPAGSSAEATPTAAAQAAATNLPASAPAETAQAAVASPPAPTSAAAETPAATSGQDVAQEITITSDPDGYHPNRVTVKAGTLIRFTVTNKDSDVHDLFNRKPHFEVTFPPMMTVTYEWLAPQEPGLYVAECTYHAGLFLKIDVQK